MKKLLVLALLSIILSYHLNSQTANYNKLKFKYNSWVHRFDADTQKGSLYKLSKDSLTLVKRKYSGNPRYTYQSYEIPILDIKTIEIRKSGRVVKGVFLGMFTGFMVGGILGYLSGDNNFESVLYLTAEEKFWFFGTLASMPGGIIGLIAGSTKIKIPIRRSQYIYDYKKKDLQKYLID